jgi:hypothetical protein
MSICFVFFGLFTFIGEFIIYIYVKETVNKNESEIDLIFDRLRSKSLLNPKVNI